MKIIYSNNEKTENTAVALGFFDGVHLGHRAVIKKAVDSKREGLCPVVFTFAQSPACALGKKDAALLTTPSDKSALIEKMGVEALVFADFSAFREMTPNKFVNEYLKNTLGAKKVFCGYNYHFGKDGLADAEMLKHLCAEAGIACEVAKKVSIDKMSVSSTKIRELIGSGEIETANKMLGSKFGFSADICHGNQIGRKMETPTINQHIPNGLVMPLFGVYGAAVTIDGKKYIGATNIGVKPTVGSDMPVCETWLLDYPPENGSLYGKTADIRFECFVRRERKFPSLDELNAQIKADADTVRNTLCK